jgi:hypothetical protein
MVVLMELVRVDDPAGLDWVKEYTAQTAIMMMIGMAIFSHLLRPRCFLATDSLPETFAFFDNTGLHPMLRAMKAHA